MGKLNVMIKDFIKCVILGSCISLGIIFIVGIISLLISKFDLKQSLQIVRSTLLIVGPLGMMLGAILILKKRDEKSLTFLDQWEKKYNVFSYRIVFVVVSCVITLYGGFVDWAILL